MHCREKTSFNPAEPKYHRLLIDLLARAQKYAAAQVKNEEQEERTISAGTKRKTPSETAETAPEKSKSKMEEGTSKSDDDDGAKETATHQHQDLRSRLVCENLERLNDLFQLFHQQTFDLAKRLGTTVFEQGKPVEQAAALASHYNQAMQHLDKLAEERDGLLTALNCIAESIAEAR